MTKRKRQLIGAVATGLLCSCLAAIPAYAANVRIELRDGSISPTQFQVTQGERVNLTIVNRGSSVHNFVIPDYYIFTSNLNPGETTTAGFDAYKTGRYVYYSDKDNVPEPGMQGHMTVKP